MFRILKIALKVIWVVVKNALPYIITETIKQSQGKDKQNG